MKIAANTDLENPNKGKVTVSDAHPQVATVAGKTASAAKACLDRKWRPVPVNFKSKECHLSGWPDYTVEDKDLPTAFADPCNIGVLLGASGLTDIDIDSETAKPFLDWLPPTGLKWGRPGNSRSHHLYKGVRPTHQFKNSKEIVFEMRSQGCYAVVPPSIHPIGEAYVWEAEGEPGAGIGLEDAVVKIAVAATLLPVWQPSARHNLALAIAGILGKRGWPAIDVLDLVTKVAKVAGDAEISDRQAAVKTTFENIEKGSPVAGYTKLVDLIGKQDADAIVQWIGPMPPDLCELATAAKSVAAKKRVAEAMRKDLQSRGTFYRTPGTAELFFFHKDERELYGIESAEFRALCVDLYRINGKEPVWSYLEADVKDHCLRHGKTTEFFKFARYQDRKLYIHAGGQRVFRLDGTKIETLDNGDDGILFTRESSLAPIEPDYGFAGSPVRNHLVNVANASDLASLDLYQIYIYTLFFESLLPTKPIVLFTGPKGSGKTSAGRGLKRALQGPSANVDTGMAGKEDAFWAAICHNSLVCIDNVDNVVPWLADALATAATGGTYKRRELYKTNTEAAYVPRCFVMITSRNPQSITRDDIVDRLLLIDVERRKDFIPESDLLAKLDQQRPRIWGELLTTLNKMVYELRQPHSKQPLSHRLADWAQLAILFAPLLGIADVEQKLKDMESSKTEFALLDHPVVQGLEDWIAINPSHDFTASGELFDAICKMHDAKGQKFPIKTPRAFGMLLKNLRLELESLYKIEEKSGSSNKKLFRFSKIKENVSPPISVQSSISLGDQL
ncbi:MAG: bifunctional DNA primase/polymerase [Planctomycetota bacterium]|nr:bifunctional DNA primase/polymerase [Planctomycetota bacterium]